jgi:hypothetical protein
VFRLNLRFDEVPKSAGPGSVFCPDQLRFGD